MLLLFFKLLFCEENKKKEKQQAVEMQRLWKPVGVYFEQATSTYPLHQE